jgi:hypothetical protein
LDVVTAALALGRALVKGGNRRVQDAMFRYFQEQTAKAEGFFEQLHLCIAAEVSHRWRTLISHPTACLS